jgi:hypothetical protein
VRKVDITWRRWRILFALPLLVTLIGCGAPSVALTPTPAAAMQTPTAVTVRQLIDGSEKYAGQTISLTGKIVVECPEGCWFFMDDGTAKIYVDLKPAGLTIPQKVGSRIELIGKTKGTGGNLQVLGDKIKFLDEP